jgi:putative membrane protein
VVTKKGWAGFLSIALCMAFSSLYEMFEWWVSIWTGSAGDSFLGTQGYIWDTQSDMFYAMIGALVGIVFFSWFHDRALKRFHI